MLLRLGILSTAQHQTARGAETSGRPLSLGVNGSMYHLAHDVKQTKLRTFIQAADELGRAVHRRRPARTLQDLWDVVQDCAANCAGFRRNYLWLWTLRSILLARARVPSWSESHTRQARSNKENAVSGSRGAGRLHSICSLHSNTANHPSKANGIHRLEEDISLAKFREVFPDQNQWVKRLASRRACSLPALREATGYTGCMGLFTMWVCLCGDRDLCAYDPEWISLHEGPLKRRLALFKRVHGFPPHPVVLLQQHRAEEETSGRPEARAEEETSGRPGVKTSGFVDSLSHGSMQAVGMSKSCLRAGIRLCKLSFYP